MPVTALTSPPAIPDHKALVAAYTFGPEGAKFVPAINLIIKYDPALLPAGAAEKDLYIAYYDGNQWQSVTGAVDTDSQTISAQITHFSTWAILGTVTPPARFNLSGIKLSADKVNPGKTVNIQATISNTGGSRGSYTAALK